MEETAFFAIILIAALIGGYLIYTSISLTTVNSTTQVNIDSLRLALGIFIVAVGLVGAVFFEKFQKDDGMGEPNMRETKGNEKSESATTTHSVLQK